MSTALARAQTAPSPVPSPTASPVVPVTYSAVVSAYAFGGRADLSNALLTITRGTGTFRYAATLGAYAFPVVGQPFAPTFSAGANTALYGYVPVAYAQYVPNARVTLTVGKIGTLLGQESEFTTQNFNIQRGLGWNMEPVVSRGVRLAYGAGKFTSALEENDGFYSGNHRAFEGQIGWSPSPQTGFDFVAMVADPNTPGNPTASVANKAEYDIMLSQSFGKLQFTPYLLFVHSPASVVAGFTAASNASCAVVLANYATGGPYSFGTRFERAHNDTRATDTSGNADLVGFGAGSAATTATFTPAFTFKQLVVRTEYSRVWASGGQSQTRYGIETAIEF